VDFLQRYPPVAGSVEFGHALYSVADKNRAQCEPSHVGLCVCGRIRACSVHDHILIKEHTSAVSRPSHLFLPFFLLFIRYPPPPRPARNSPLKYTARILFTVEINSYL
jgi:hypothetical protein